MHNCCVDWASRIVKYNVSKGSIACKSLLYEGDVTLLVVGFED